MGAFVRSAFDPTILVDVFIRVDARGRAWTSVDTRFRGRPRLSALARDRRSRSLVHAHAAAANRARASPLAGHAFAAGARSGAISLAAGRPPLDISASKEGIL